MAHPRLSDVAEPMVNALLARLQAPWANQHIVCLGDWTYDHDLPPRIKRLFCAEYPTVAEHAILTAPEPDSESEDEDDGLSQGFDDEYDWEYSSTSQSSGEKYSLEFDFLCRQFRHRRYRMDVNRMWI